MYICDGCKNTFEEEVPKRRCTRERLCCYCRGLPEYKIVTAAHLKKILPNLNHTDLPAPVGYIVNNKNPAYKKQKVYLLEDVLEICLALDCL